MLSTLGHNELASPPTRSGFMFPYAACPSRLWACLGRHWSDPAPSHPYGVWDLAIRAHPALGALLGIALIQQVDAKAYPHAIEDELGQETHSTA